MDSQGDTFRIVIQDGRCENGNAMGGYDFQCIVAAGDTMSCTHRNPSGNLIHMMLTKIFP